MNAYDEEMWGRATPPPKVHDKLAWQTQVREELEDMNSENVFYVVIKVVAESDSYDEMDFSYHRTYQLALQATFEIADEYGCDMDQRNANSFYLEGPSGNYIEFYVEEREFNE